MVYIVGSKLVFHSYIFQHYQGIWKVNACLETVLTVKNTIQKSYPIVHPQGDKSENIK